MKAGEYMEREVMQIMKTQGVFAVLFCFMLFYVLRENSKREGKYQEIISNLTDKFEDIKDDVKEIKNKIFK